jgi:hypothetical protein
VVKTQKKEIKGDSITFSLNAKDAERLVLMYRSHERALFKSVEIKDFMGHPIEEGHRERKITLPLSEVKHYYFVAEGDQAITTFPARASREYLEVK